MEATVHQVEYDGRLLEYQNPLGIYLDGEITGRIRDSIIPKYNEISPTQLSLLNPEDVKTVRDNAKRQLEGIAQQDTEEVRKALQNTVDLTTSMLE